MESSTALTKKMHICEQCKRRYNYIKRMAYHLLEKMETIAESVYSKRVGRYLAETYEPMHSYQVYPGSSSQKIMVIMIES